MKIESIFLNLSDKINKYPAYSNILINKSKLLIFKCQNIAILGAPG